LDLILQNAHQSIAFTTIATAALSLKWKDQYYLSNGKILYKMCHRSIGMVVPTSTKDLETFLSQPAFK